MQAPHRLVALRRLLSPAMSVPRALADCEGKAVASSHHHL